MQDFQFCKYSVDLLDHEHIIFLIATCTEFKLHDSMHVIKWRIVLEHIAIIITMLQII